MGVGVLYQVLQRERKVLQKRSHKADASLADAIEKIRKHELEIGDAKVSK